MSTNPEVQRGIKMIPLPKMAMTLRLSEKEQRALKKRAERDGVSMQDAARRAIREYLDNSEHTTRVIDAAKQIMKVHAEAIEQLVD